MNERTLVVVAGCDLSPSVLAELGTSPGPRTETLASCAIPHEQARALVQSLRERSPEARIAVHSGRPDAIGYSHCARVLHLAPDGATLFTELGCQGLNVDVVSLGRIRLPGTLRRVELWSSRALEIVERPRLPEPPVLATARERDLQSLEELIGFGIRVVDLGGAPGIGKSHVLVRLAHRMAAAGRRPVFVDVMGYLPFGVLAALGREVGIPLDARLGDQRVLARLAAGLERSPVDVVVLDHVPEEVVPALRQLVASTTLQWVFGGVRQIGIGSEVIYELRGLRRGEDEDLLRARAPHLGDQAEVLAEPLDGSPIALEVLAGWTLDAVPLVVFEWLSGGPRTLEELTLQAYEALPEVTRERLLKLVVWPDALGVDVQEPCVRQLLDRGWLRVTYDPAVPGMPAIRLHPYLRSILLDHVEPPESCYVDLYEWMASQSRALHRMLQQAQAPCVFDVVSAWVPSLDAILERVLTTNPISSRHLTWLAPILELRVACGTRLGSVEGTLQRLEKALQGAGARFDLDPVVVIRLFLARGEAFLHLRAWERARADLERARNLAERRQEAELLARVTLLLARVAQGSGRHDLAVKHLDALVVPEDALWRGEIPALRGTLLMAASKDEGALVAFQEARELAKHGDPALLAAVAMERAVLLRRTGNRAGSRAAYEEAVEAWADAGRPETESAALFQLALLLQSEGELVAARVRLLEVERRARNSGEDARRGLVCVQRALIALEEGELAEAHAQLVDALSAARLGGDRAGQGAARGFLSLSMHLQGHLQEARDGYRGALRDLESGADRRFGALFHTLLGAAEAELGNLHEARISVDMARLRLPDADPGMQEAVGVFELVVEVARASATGEREQALERVRGTLEELAGRPDNLYLRFARRYLEGLVKESA